jgi:hypothetical protein
MVYYCRKAAEGGNRLTKKLSMTTRNLRAEVRAETTDWERKNGFTMEPWTHKNEFR